MIRFLLGKLTELLLPERAGDTDTPSREPIDLLASLYSKLSRLAAQIQAHAEIAPYPHIADQLRRIASEKQASAKRLKEIVESEYGWIRDSSEPVAAGQNHWERLQRDLEDQRALEGFLVTHEPRLSEQSPEIAESVRQLRTSQAAHKAMLTALLGLADPQATQT